MSGFRAVNTELTVDDSHRPLEVTTPTTPRPPGSSVTTSHVPPPQDESSPNTPTRHTFSGIPGQRPLPTSSYAEPTQAHPINGPVAAVASISRESSQRSVHSDGSHDVEMDSDDGGDQSDDGSGGDPNKPSKKKKGQRFFCTDFPPCTLSFTRSEHLARHIRKHTGERPFQCHCTRRFSRLDNLRQHAQTVHVNEEIPPESLAATGTRFQRQVRTDRVRPAGNRSRSSTLGSQGSVGRSHSRNLSTSSIGSTASSFSQREDTRRRPAPLMMASDPVSRARLTIDTFRDSPDSPGNRDVPYRGYAPESPGGFHTPTSATYSNGAGSPRFSSALQSPMSQSSRSSGYWGNRTPGRRLSVPSGTSPFQSPSANNFPQPFMSPLASSTSSNFSGSMFTSPTSSTYSSEYQPNATAAREAEYKRRTWHPETNSGLQRRVANPGLHFFNNSSHPSALAYNRPWSQSSQSSETRLPGIESFDQIHNRPSTPPRRGPSPMQLDTPSRQPPPMSPPEQGAPGLDGRKGMAEWGMSLHRNLNRLDLASTPPTEQRPPSWHGRPTTSYDNSRPPSWHGPNNTPPVPEHRAQVSFQEPPRPGTAPHAHNPPPFQPIQHGQGQIITQHAQSRPRDPTSPTQLQPETPRKKKRQGWYAGPLTAHAPLQSQIQVAGPSMEDKGAKRRLSPEDSSSSEGVPTPGSTSVGSEWHPNIVGLNGGVNGGGWGESGDQTYTHAVDVAHQRPISESESTQPKRERDMLRLEALVAVATSEDKTPQPQKV